MADKVRSGGARGKAGARWIKWFRDRQAQCWTGGYNTRELARICTGCGEPIRVKDILSVKVVSWVGGLRPRRRTHWEYWHKGCWNKSGR